MTIVELMKALMEAAVAIENPDAIIEASCQTGCHEEDERGHPIWLEILGVAYATAEGEVDSEHVLLTLGEVTMV